MRTKGDGVWKSGREKHDEEGTYVWKLKGGYSAERTDGVKQGCNIGPSTAWKGANNTNSSNHSSCTGRFVHSKFITVFKTKHTKTSFWFILATFLIYTVNGLLSCVGFSLDSHRLHYEMRKKNPKQTKLP